MTLWTNEFVCQTHSESEMRRNRRNLCFYNFWVAYLVFQATDCRGNNYIAMLWLFVYPIVIEIEQATKFKYLITYPITLGLLLELVQLTHTIIFLLSLECIYRHECELKAHLATVAAAQYGHYRPQRQQSLAKFNATHSIHLQRIVSLLFLRFAISLNSFHKYFTWKLFSIIFVPWFPLFHLKLSI